jgi:hypothetical protein
VPGDKFLIEYRDELNAETWHSVASTTLTNTTSIWIDYNSANTEKRFYRATFQGR